MSRRCPVIFIVLRDLARAVPEEVRQELLAGLRRRMEVHAQVENIIDRAAPDSRGLRAANARGSLADDLTLRALNGDPPTTEESEGLLSDRMNDRERRLRIAYLVGNAFESAYGHLARGGGERLLVKRALADLWVNGENESRGFWAYELLEDAFSVEFEELNQEVEQGMAEEE